MLKRQTSGCLNSVVSLSTRLFVNNAEIRTLAERVWGGASRPATDLA